MHLNKIVKTLDSAFPHMGIASGHVVSFADGLPTIDDGLAFYISQLANVEAKIYEAKYANINYEELIPINTDVPEWADSWDYISYDAVTLGKFIGSSADDLPNVSLSANKSSVPIGYAGNIFDYSLDELRKSQKLRMPIDVLKARAAFRGAKEHSQRVAYFGDASRKMTGLFNNPNLALTNSTLDWFSPTTTGDEIVADMNKPLVSTWVNSAQVHLPNVFILDSRRFALISERRMGAGRQDGDFVVVDLTVKDAKAIKQVEEGLVELSAGYTAEYYDEKGVAPDGTPYDYVQRDIKINHVALVPTARAGRQARLFDTNPKVIIMTTIVLDSGRNVEIEDAAVAMLVTDSIARLQKVIDEAKADSEKKQAKIDAMEEEAEKKKGETADAIIAQRLAALADVTGKAKVIDAEYTSDSVDATVIMRGVLTKARPTVDWAAKSDDYVLASFDMAHEGAKDKKPSNAQQLSQLSQDAASGAIQPQVSAYQAHKVATGDAWKKSVQ